MVAACQPLLKKERSLAAKCLVLCRLANSLIFSDRLADFPSAMFFNWRFWLAVLTVSLVLGLAGFSPPLYVLGLLAFTSLMELLSWHTRNRFYGQLVLRLSRPIGPQWFRWLEMACAAVPLVIILGSRLGWVRATPLWVLACSAACLLLFLRLRLQRNPAEIRPFGLLAGADVYAWEAIKSYTLNEGILEVTARGWARSEERVRLSVTPEEADTLRNEFARSLPAPLSAPGERPSAESFQRADLVTFPHEQSGGGTVLALIFAVAVLLVFLMLLMRPLHLPLPFALLIPPAIVALFILGQVQVYNLSKTVLRVENGVATVQRSLKGWTLPVKRVHLDRLRRVGIQVIHKQDRYALRVRLFTDQPHRTVTIKGTSRTVTGCQTFIRQLQSLLGDEAQYEIAQYP